MLSKSQAKAFFVLGTAAFSAIFIGLTIDTFQRIPKQTNANQLTDSAIRGKHLFDKKNCMGCHTIMGEGAYYAPELTKVIDRRGEAFVKAVLKDPEAMYPGQRKMINYKFNDQEIEDLASFLTWVGKMDLNGFPPKPDMIATAGYGAGNNPLETVKQPQIFGQVCTACHALNGRGGNVGPALDGVGSKFDIQYITQWLKDPAAIKMDTKMPKLPLSDNDIAELATYLSSLKGETK
jgi:nitric oxide reductase subunit C